MSLCDCGAKSVGIKDGAAGHSNWCTSLSTEAKVEKKKLKLNFNKWPLNPPVLHPSVSPNAFAQSFGNWKVYTDKSLGALYISITQNIQNVPLTFTFTLFEKTRDLRFQLNDPSNYIRNVTNGMLTWSQSQVMIEVANQFHNNYNMTIPEQVNFLDGLDWGWIQMGWP